MKLVDRVELILKRKGSEVHSITPEVTVYEALEKMAVNPDFHFSFGSANHRVDSDAFIYAGLKALNQDFHFGPGTVTGYTPAAPNTTSFRAEPCTSPPPVGARARPSAHRR